MAMSRQEFEQLKSAIESGEISRIPQDKIGDYNQHAYKDLSHQENPALAFLDEAKDVRVENSAKIDSLIGEGDTVLKGAGLNAIMGLGGNYGKFASTLDGITLDYGELPEYVGDVNSQAAGAQADGRSIDAQYDALGQLSALTDPSVTAKEKFLYEQSRQRQERDQKSYMDSVLSNLDARGIKSGGATIGALQASQQETGNRRMLQDMAANAGAVDRSLSALDQYGNLAGNIRGQSFNEDFATGSAADDVAKFNSTLRTDTNFRRAGMADHRVETGAKFDVGKAGLVKDSADGFEKDKFGFSTLPYENKKDLTLAGVTGNRADTALTGDGYRTLLGKESSDAAIAALEGDEFNLFNPTSWF